MSIQNKPDYKIFASGAKTGEIDLFPDILRGWGVTIDQTGEVPPMEWFNALGKRVDEWLLYLTQRGIPEWDSSLDYPVGAMVFTAGKFYISLTANKAKNPTLSSTDWKEFTKFFDIDKKVDKSDIVQVTGTSTTQVMSQKSVTDTLNAKELSTKAYVDTEKAKYLPLTGGSITGDIQHQVSQRTFNINSGVGAQGAGLQLFPDDSTQGDLQGAFALYSQVKAGNNYFLIGKNNGCLYWNGSQVMTVGVGTTVTGVNNFSNGLQINGHSVTIG